VRESALTLDQKALFAHGNWERLMNHASREKS